MKIVGWICLVALVLAGISWKELAAQSTPGRPEQPVRPKKGTIDRDNQKLMQGHLRLMEKALAVWRSGDLAKAESMLRKAYAGLPSDTIAYELGLLLVERGKREEGRNLLYRVTHPDRGHASSLANEALVLVQFAEVSRDTGHPEDAQWALRKSDARNWYDAHMKAAGGAMWRESYDLAIVSYEKALEEKPGDAEAKAGIKRARRDAAARTRKP